MSAPAAWWQFARERFEPVSHLLMILLFFGGHVVFAAAEPTWAAAVAAAWGPGLGWLALGTLCFFFKLRLYDEIKDYELDRVINPGRPLVRGLLTHRDLFIGIALCIAVELATFGGQGGLATLPAIGFAVLYSLLMYKEFLISGWLRPRLTTYAVSHTVVCGFLSVAMLTALSRRPVWALGVDAWLFAGANWCLFNVFELGRKTFASSEERPNVASYSRIFGRLGAVALVLAMATAAVAAIAATAAGSARGFLAVQLALVVILGVAGAAFALTDRLRLAKTYRAMSSVYIVLFYLGLVGTFLAHALA